MKTASLFTIAGLHKTYGSKQNAYQALRGLDLVVATGESVAIIGKSGSGKSTLMHVMAGLDSPTSGEVVYKDRPLHGQRERTLAQLRNEDFGFIFQQFFLQPRLTVLENVALPLKIRGVGKAERERRARAILEEVGLLDKAKNKATDLSGGQKQRVAIARALVNDPAVVFADEPTGNLDTENGEHIMTILFRLQKERGITLVIVTHDEDIARRCDRQVIIQDGTIVSATAKSASTAKPKKKS